MIYPVTDYILYDEPCYGLYELNLKSADQKSHRRFQIAIVIRNDRFAEYRKDLGESKNFKGLDQFRIPGGVTDETTGRIDILHTVGELIDIANDLRTHRPFDKRELAQVNQIND